MQAMFTALFIMTLGFGLMRARQLRRYRRLARCQARIVAGAPLSLTTVVAQPGPAFDRHLATLADVLDNSQWSPIRAEVAALTDTERSYLPAHKQGGTIAYETLIMNAPAVVALYQSPSFQAQIAAIVGEPVVPTPLHDQSSLSVLCYERPGDHIGWHFDHNFYRGRHFTVLLPVENRGRADGGRSHAALMVRDGAERVVPTPPNSLVVFEGSRVLHKVTPIQDGERRVVISMTYCTDPQNRWWQGFARRIKDIAFFGPRALWT
jgi:hypothetical protein